MRRKRTPFSEWTRHAREGGVLRMSLEEIEHRPEGPKATNTCHIEMPLRHARKHDVFGKLSVSMVLAGRDSDE